MKTNKSKVSVLTQCLIDYGSFCPVICICLFVNFVEQAVHPAVSNHSKKPSDCEFTKLSLFLFLYHSASACMPDAHQKESSDLYLLFYTEVLTEIFLSKKPYTFELL